MERQEIGAWMAWAGTLLITSTLYSLLRKAENRGQRLIFTGVFTTG